MMMGFKDDGDVSAFIRYWDYINGHEYTEDESGEDAGDGTYDATEFDLASVLPDDVLADHDYIGALKYYDPTLKIGLPAANFNHCEEWDTPFIVGDPDEDVTLPPGEEPCEECIYAQWNIDMETKFSHTVGGGTSSYPKFDAVILHNYYIAGNRWEECAENTNWLVAATEPTFLAETPYTEHWITPGFDPVLGVLFEGIAGIPTDPDGDLEFEEQTGNFKEFTRDRIKIGFDIHAGFLNFFDEDEGPTKEFWFTEFNLLPKTHELDEDMLPFVNMVPNTFAHAVVLQNWILWNLKAYFDPDYKPGVFTVATVQAYMGGNTIDMMTAASRTDQVVLDIPDPGLSCTTGGPEEDNYYVRRTTWHTMQLLSNIHTQDLHYLKTHVGIYTLNNNQAPTCFVELDAEGEPVNVIVYYTNIKQTTQKFAIDPGDLYITIDGATGVTLGEATIYTLNPFQLSTTSGNNVMFKNDQPVNISYACSPADGSDPHPFEITETESSVSGTSCPGGFTPPIGGVCVTVPATSAGYFVVPITAEYRKGAMKSVYSIYPNPSDEYFVINRSNQDPLAANDMHIGIYSSYGTLETEKIIRSGEVVSTQMLPSGVYTIVVKTENEPVAVLRFVKMQ